MPALCTSRLPHAPTTPRSLQALAPGPHRILVGGGAAEPALLVQALTERSAELSGSEVVHLLTLGPAPYVEQPHWWVGGMGGHWEPCCSKLSCSSQGHVDVESDAALQQLRCPSS